MAENNSILDDTKITLGVLPDYTPFDQTIMIHINSVFADLNQMGVGPAAGFMIADNTATWDLFLGDGLLLNNVKSYMYLRVKVLFDGPDSRYVIAAITEQIKQWEWRINVARETTAWVDPNPVLPQTP